MTRKDYVKVADILSAHAPFIEDALAYRDMVEDFALMFRADNQNFDANRFYAACGLVRV